MADNSCGPSNNGLKRVVQLADRDRSLQQDRVSSTAQTAVNGSFRNPQGPLVSADGAFDNFQAGRPGPALSPAAMVNHALAAGPSTAPYPRVIAPPPGIPFPTGAQIAAGGNWVSQFSQMNLANPGLDQHVAMLPDMATASLPQHARGNEQVMRAPVMSPADYHATNPGSAYSAYTLAARMGPSYQPALAPAPPAQMPVTFPYQPAMSDSGDAQAQAEAHAAALASNEAFNAAFDEYEEVGAGDEDFQAEMDNWMSQHGPPRPSLLRAVSDEPAEIEATMRQLADELDARRAAGDPAVLPTVGAAADARRARREQDELAEAALDILNSVGSNTSEKFRNSSFFDLMRRIRDREVVVDGDRLVESETGETVVTRGSGGQTEATAETKEGDAPPDQENGSAGPSDVENGKGKEKAL